MVEKLRELTRAATPGPWVWATDKGAPTYVQLYMPDAEFTEYEADVISASGDDVLVAEVNADLIVAMRNALPALLDVVEAARAVEESESVGQPSVDPRALKRLRDALGRLEG